LVHWEMCLFIGELGYRQEKERCGRSAGVVLGSYGRGGQWLAAEGDEMWLWRRPSYLRRCSRRLSSATGSWIRLWRRRCSSGQCLGYLSGNSQEGGKQRHKQLQMEPRDLLALVMFRQIQFNFTSFHSRVLKCSRQQVTPEQRNGVTYRHYLHCSHYNIPVIKFMRMLWSVRVARMSY
jgi:hypothetical protein